MASVVEIVLMLSIIICFDVEIVLMPSIIICFVVEIVLMPSIIICFVVEIVPMPSIIICFVVEIVPMPSIMIDGISTISSLKHQKANNRNINNLNICFQILMNVGQLAHVINFVQTR
jgi:hypothetical protein